MKGLKKKSHKKFVNEATKLGYIVEPYVHTLQRIVPSIVVSHEGELNEFSNKTGIKKISLVPMGFRIRLFPST